MTHDEGYVIGFVRELTAAKRLDEIKAHLGIELGDKGPIVHLGVYKAVFQKSISAQIRQLIRYMKDKLTDLCGN